MKFSLSCSHHSLTRLLLLLLLQYMRLEMWCLFRQVATVITWAEAELLDGFKATILDQSKPYRSVLFSFSDSSLQPCLTFPLIFAISPRLQTSSKILCFSLWIKIQEASWSLEILKTSLFSSHLPLSSALLLFCKVLNVKRLAVHHLV